MGSDLQHFWLVARTESLDLVVPHPFGAIGVSPTLPAHSNVTGQTIDRWVELTPDVAEDLRKRNPHDVILYEAARRLERRFLERVGHDDAPRSLARVKRP